jgi:uncharacterized protein (DUF305 family)
MPRAWKNVAALATAGGMALAACGGDDDAPSSGARSGPGNPTDRAFVTDVVPLEEKTVSLAQIALQRATSGFVQRLAGDIVRDQTRQIGTMRRIGTGLSAANVRIGSLGVDRRTRAVNASTASLQAARLFDPAFLRAVIPLHDGAVAMARVELANGQQAHLRAVAQQIVDTSGAQLTAMRKRLGR